MAAAGALCWLLPGLLDLPFGWAVAGRIAAWLLFTIGTAGALVELDKERPGFGDLAVAAILLSIGLGLLALGTQALEGVLEAIVGVIGALGLVFSVIVGGMSAGKIASPAQESPGAPTTSAQSSFAIQPQPGRRRLQRGEVLSLVLSALQVLLAAAALFWGS